MRKFLLGCLVLIMTGFILYQGTRPIHISLQSSDYVVYKLMRLLEKVTPYHYGEFYKLANVIVRKGGAFI